MSRFAFAAVLLISSAALAQTGNHPVTGGADVSKTTTSATEKKTTDAAGLGAPVPGSVNVPRKPTTPHHHHHHHHPHPHTIAHGG